MKITLQEKSIQIYPQEEMNSKILEREFDREIKSIQQALTYPKNEIINQLFIKVSELIVVKS